MGEPLRFDERVAIVTGAGNGLGRAHALLLAERGAMVVVNDLGGAVDGTGRSGGAAALVAEEIRALGGEAVADTNSVATQASGEAVVATALEHFGRVDILVNNAGVLRDQTFHKAAPEDVSMVLDVHVGGAFWVGSAAFRQMREQQYGRIVNTSSAAGLFGNFGQASYATAKMGLVGLTRVMAIEGARYGIKANVIAPGARTRMTEELLGPLADRFLPEHVAPVVAYLAHESCPVTGSIFAAAAGRVAKIFVAETRGIFEADLTLEDVGDRFGEICDEVGYVVPASVEDEQALIVAHL